MARVAEKKKPAAAENSSAAALAIISPDLPLTLAGRAIVVREYGFFEGLAVAHRAEGFIADMHNMCRGGELRYDRIRRLFGVHRDVVIEIAAQAADVEPEWVAALKGSDAESFMSAWFSVNASFFVHEVIVEMREERQRQALGSTGASSSSASLRPGSGTSIASDGSPSGS